MTYKNSNGNEFRFTRAFEGVITNLERRYRETNSELIREKISEFMSDRPCPTCKGKRLNPSALAVTVDDINIVEAKFLARVEDTGMGQEDLRQEFSADIQAEDDRRTRLEGNP